MTDPITLEYPNYFNPLDNNHYNSVGMNDQEVKALTIKKNRENYYRNTIAPAITAADLGIPAEVVNKPAPGSDSVSGIRPKLEAPKLEAKKLQTTLSSSNNHLIHEVEKKAKTTTEMTESQVMSMLYKCFHEQRNLTENEAMIVLNFVKQKQEECKKLGKDYFDYLDQMIARSSESKILTWLKWVFVGASVLVLGGASLVLTAGASLPAVLVKAIALFSAASGMGSGALQITQGIHSYKTNLIRGEMGAVKSNRELLDIKISSDMEKMKHDFEIVHSIVQQETEILHNHYEASRMN